MKRIKVKDLMVKLDDFAVVSEEASLFEAMAALMSSHQRHQKSTFRHRAILVLDKAGNLTGRIRLWDLLHGLEPGYGQMESFKHASELGFNLEYMRSALKEYGLWQRPLEDICRKAGQVKAKEIMHVIEKDEYISAEATLDEAINHLVMGRYPSLIVTGEGKVIGILRLADVIEWLWKEMQACQL